MYVRIVWGKLRSGARSANTRGAETSSYNVRDTLKSRRLLSTEDHFMKRVGYARRLSQQRKG